MVKLLNHNSSEQEWVNPEHIVSFVGVGKSTKNGLHPRTRIYFSTGETATYEIDPHDLATQL
ncbi:hypothetical protein SEA_LENNOX_48 [Arthrobacter phage Lennox]|uniref:Uncharacterized protein n=1 Tax=Arthrobacter phage Lennox TaxID=2499007 RepID=A0A3S9UEG7_9CAUD|nr:hypothetical protein SEA_LENNOX_48 [Arthrobacter phage Lennox]